MRLLSVQLTNVKSYADQTVRFEGGTNCITGPNGAGKSTILEAVGWALFNSLPYNQKQFQRDGTQYGMVVVAFVAADGREYQVVRKTGGAAPLWYVFDVEINDKPAEGAADVRDWLQRRLGMEDAADPQILFENAVGVPQGGLTAPFLQSPQRRREAFNQVLRVDEYADASERLLETKRLLDDRVRDQEGEADRHAAEADRVPELREGVKQLDETLGRTRSALAGRETERLRLDAERRRLELEEQRLGELRRAAENAAGDVRAEEKALAGATARVDEAWRAHETVERSALAYALYEDARRRLGELEPRYDEYNRLLRETEAARAERDGARRELTRLEAEEAHAGAASAELPALLQRANRARELQDTLGSLERDAASLPERQREHQTLARQLGQDRAEAERLGREIARIEGLRGDADMMPEVRARQAELADSVATARQAAARVRSLAEELRTDERALEGDERALRQLTERSRVAPEHALLAGRLPALEREEREAEELRTELQGRYRELKALREARVVECPLSRDDCLSLQRDRLRDDRLGVELGAVKERGLLAKQALDGLRETVARARRVVEDVRSADAERVRVDAETARLRETRGRRDARAAQLAAEREAADSLPGLERELGAIVGELDRVEASTRDVGRLPDLVTARTQRTGTIEEREARLRELAAALERIRAGAAEMAALRPRLAELGDAAGALARAQARADALPALQQSVEAQRAKLEAAEDRLRTLEVRVAPLASIGEQMRAARAALRENQEARDAYVGALERAEELPARQREQKELETRLEERRAELSRAERLHDDALRAWDGPALERTRSRLQELAGEIGQLGATLANTEQRLGELRDRLAAAEEHAARRDAALRERDRLDALRENLACVRRVLKAAQGPVTEALLYGVSQEARGIFSDLMDDGSARLSWTSDYDVQLERGTERLTFPQMSGGEQMSAALAVRLALLKKLSDVDIAFLDEPTQNMDETRRTNLAEKVREIRGFEQLFVISHDDTFERLVNHAVVVRKRDGQSVVAYGHDGG